MKKLYKILMLLTALCLSNALWANDTISFAWQGSTSSKSFQIQATKGKAFTINWGDGKDTTYTGQGTANINPTHTYADTNSYIVTIAGNAVDCDFTSLFCSFNQLTALDVSKNTALTNLYCYDNLLATLDVSNNTALTRLNCSSNQLITLDVSQNTALIYLECDNNALPLADLYKASQKISTVDNKRLGTQNLPAKEVELNIPITLTADSVLGGVNTAYANILKNWQTAMAGTDYVLNGNQITFKTSGTYTITMTNSSITSHASYPAQVIATYIAGTVEPQQIQFTWVGSTNSKNFTIQASYDKTFTVNWGDGTNNTYIGQGDAYTVSPAHTYADTNSYTVTITGSSADCFIIYLECYNNQLTTLDVSKAIALTQLSCSMNQLEALDLNKNTVLTYLDCSNTPLTALDVSKNPALTYLYCFDNQLTNLDLSNNTSLSFLECYNTPLTTLDVSKNPALTYLGCSNTSLTALDISQNLALTYLYCYNNLLTTLNLSQNAKLTYLYCYNNLLTTLDVSKNTKLIGLNCYNNLLTTLDVSKNPALTRLNCFSNQLTTLDVSKNTALIELYCDDNPLTTLDVSKNTVLKRLLCTNNQLTALDVSKNTALTKLSCNHNRLTALNVSENTALTELDCSTNQLMALDVSKNMVLKSLLCYTNQLTALDVSKDTALTSLECDSNALPLADLYKASQKISDVFNKRLGTQNLPAKEVELNIPIAITADSVLGGVNTIYTNIQKNGQAAVPETDYVLTGNQITFKTKGVYTISMTNSSITSYTSNPAQVITAFAAGGISTDATLKSLTVSEGTLTPVFAANTTNYTVNLPYQDSIITVTSTANYSLATVSGNVTDTALVVGNNLVSITVTAEDGITKKKYAVNIVRVKFGGVSGISLNTHNLALKVDSIGVLSATIVPNNAINQTVSWTSTDTNIATVSNGTVSAKAAGSAYIIVTTEDGGYKDSCLVTITQPVTGISMMHTLTLNFGETTTITATVEPAKASNQTIIWQSRDETVVFVDTVGTVTALKTGQVYVIATTQDGGFQDSCLVTVIQPVTGVTINPKTRYAKIGDHYVFVAIVKPSNASNKTVTWISRDSNIASVDIEGEVTAKTVGTTYIVITTQDGGFQDSCLVTVTANIIAVTGITLNAHSLAMKVDSVKTLTATIIPSNATNQNINWSSDNTDIATVSNGTITAKAVGTTYIIATAGDGGYKDSCLVTVTANIIAVTGITLNTHSLAMKVDSIKTLTTTITPSNATNQTISWNSSNTDIATVSNGTITAKAVGTAYIIATAEDGGLKDSCSVTVTANMDAIVELNTNKSIAIYPNPTINQLKVESGTLKVEKVQLLDITGKLVFETKETSFNVEYLPKGVYSIRVFTEKGVVIRKVVKQ